MRPDVATDEKAVAATVEVAVVNVRKRSSAAAQLLNLCSFLAADDIPRKMLSRSAHELPAEMRAPIADPRALHEAIGILRRYALLRVHEDGLAVHRSTQRAVREALDERDRTAWCAGAGRIVRASFPDRPEDTRNWSSAARLLPHALASADHLDEQDVEPLLAVELRDLAARYVIPQGQLDIAQDLVERALERVERVAPRSILHGTVLGRLAVIERERGWFNIAKRHATEALGIHQAAAAWIERSAATRKSVSPREPDAELGADVHAVNHPQIVEDLQNLSSIARSQGDLPAAMEYLESAYTMLVELRGPDDSRVADLLIELFNLFVDANRVTDGIDALGRAIEIRQAAFGADDDDVVINRHLYALMTEPENRDERAREVLRRSEKIYGERHPNTADASGLLAVLLRGLGQLDEARRMADRALEIDRGNYGPGHFRVGSGLVGLMAIDAEAGDIDTAEDRLRQVTDLVLASPPDDRVTTLRLSGVGDALADAAAREPSARLAQRALATFDAAFTDLGELRFFALELVVKAFMTAGDVLLVGDAAEHAAAKYEDGLRLALLTTENSLDDALFHVRLGLLAASRGEHAAMDEHFRSAMACFREAGAPVPVWQVVAECSALCGAVGRVPVAEQALSKLINEAIEGGTVPEFRGELTAALPGDWFAKESTTLLAPDGQANVIASSEPLDPSIDTDRYASVQGDLLRGEFPGYEEKSFDRIEIFGGRSGYMRHFQWTPPDGVPVVQLQLYYAENGRGYTATATTPAEGFPSRELLLRQILLGLRIVG